MKAYVDTVGSPAGDLAFAVDGEGALVFLEFVERDGGRGMEEALWDEGFEVSRDGGFPRRPGKSCGSTRPVGGGSSGCRSRS